MGSHRGAQVAGIKLIPVTGEGKTHHCRDSIHLGTCQQVDHAGGNGRAGHWALRLRPSSIGSCPAVSAAPETNTFTVLA